MAGIVDRMYASRESWCELAPAADGKPAQRVKLRRPPQMEIARLRGGVTQDEVLAAAVDWDGFTEADLLGPAVGASDPVPFSAEVWSAYVLDNVAALSLAAKHLQGEISAHLKRLDATRKN